MGVRACIVIWCLIANSVHGSNSSAIECLPRIVLSSAEKQEIEVKLEHTQSSITNGSPYGPKTISTHVLIFNQSITTNTATFAASRSNYQTVNFAYNGSHVCASAQYLNDYERCDFTGCHKNTSTTCDSVCFLATDFYKRHSVSIFQSYTRSSYSDLGEWYMFDTVYMTTRERMIRELNCYSLEKPYDVFPSHFIEPTPNVTKCPIGQRCRITIGKYTVTSFPKVFVGCEVTVGHYDGCQEGCTTRQRSPDGYTVNWASMCRYCCSRDFCNDPKKCISNKLQCDLGKELKSYANRSVAMTTVTFLHLTCLSFILHFSGYV